MGGTSIERKDKPVAKARNAKNRDINKFYGFCGGRSLIVVVLVDRIGFGGGPVLSVVVPQWS